MNRVSKHVSDKYLFNRLIIRQVCHGLQVCHTIVRNATHARAIKSHSAFGGVVKTHTVQIKLYGKLSWSCLQSKPRCQ